MNDVLTVADAVLKIAKKRGHQLTPLQLMKLVYITHGFSLALRNKPLFHNRIEAWRHGPVMPDLYQATKNFGRNQIPLSKVGNEDDISLDEQEVGLVTSVFDKYSHLDGIALSYLTHQSGTPWDETYQPGWNSAVIPNELIKSHYEDLLGG